MQQLKHVIVALGITLVGFIGMTIIHVQTSEINHIYTLETVPHRPIAIILGAAVKPDGSLSDALADRVQTGIDLYHTGLVDQILLTGDGGAFRRNEITAMHTTTQAAGIDAEDILKDERGFRTYESCKRASQEFGITEATIVTQRFHLARALYLCRSLGIDAVGVPADRQPYRRILWHWTRDLLASVKAYNDLFFWTPNSPVPEEGKS